MRGTRPSRSSISTERRPHRVIGFCSGTDYLAASAAPPLAPQASDRVDLAFIDLADAQRLVTRSPVDVRSPGGG